MILRKFKETGPDVIVMICIVAILVWLGAFLHPAPSSAGGFDEKPMPLFGILLNISGQLPFTGVLISFLIVLLIAFLLVNFNTSDFFISERTFLPAVIFVLLSGFFPVGQTINPALPASVFLILALRKIMESYKVNYTAYTYFDAGILLGCGGLFYANFIWFGLLLFFGIALLRTVNLKEVLISVIGLITPWFITFGLYYLAGNDIPNLIEDIKYNLFGKIQPARLTLLTVIFLSVMGVITLISLLQLFSVINTKKIKSRKTFRLILWAFLISVVVSILIHPWSVEMFWISIIPVSYVISHYLVFLRKKIAGEIVMLLMMAMIAIIQITFVR